VDRRYCPGCGWLGTDDDLINPGGLGRDRFIEGDCCPRCEEPIDETIAIFDRICTQNRPNCLQETTHVRISDEFLKCTECGNIVILPVEGYKPKNPFTTEVDPDWSGDRVKGGVYLKDKRRRR